MRNMIKEGETRNKLKRSNTPHPDTIVVGIDRTPIGMNKTSLVRTLVHVIWHTIIVRVFGANISGGIVRHL